MQILERIVNKLTSGKFLLTAIGGLVFGYVACKQILPPEAIATILTAIFMSYFNKKGEGDNAQTTVSKSYQEKGVGG